MPATRPGRAIVMLETSVLKGIAPVILLVSASGCFRWERAAAGPVSATTLERDRVGGQLTVDASVGGDDALGYHVFADGKVTERGGDGGLGLGALVFPFAMPLSFFGRAGVHLFQVGSWNDKRTPEGKVSFGMFGPVAEAGLVITALRGNIITLSTQVQFDVRFTEQPHEGFWGAALGFGRHRRRMFARSERGAPRSANLRRLPPTR